MNILRFFKATPTPLIGIDIGFSAIKLLSLSKVTTGYKIESYQIEPLPLNSVVEKNIKSVTEVSKSIYQALMKAKTEIRCVACAVPGASVVTRIIQTDASYNDEQINEQINVEAHQYLPIPLEEVYYDFTILGPLKNHSTLKEVYLAAARQESVDSRVAAMTEAGLKTTIVDIESLAVERAFSLIAKQLPFLGKTPIVALIDIGEMITTTHVFKKGRSIYSRDQVFGENKGTESETVVKQIIHALQLFRSSSEEEQIDCIVLAGGGSLLKGLLSLTQEKTGIQTLIINPFLNMAISEKVEKTSLFSNSTRMLTCLGLALRTFDGQTD